MLAMAKVFFASLTLRRLVLRRLQDYKTTRLQVAAAVHFADKRRKTKGKSLRGTESIESFELRALSLEPASPRPLSVVRCLLS